MLPLLLLSRFSRVRLVWPHRWQPTRLPRPWDSPGKNTKSAISFSNAWKWKVKVKSLSHARLLVTPWTTANANEHSYLAGSYNVISVFLNNISINLNNNPYFPNVKVFLDSPAKAVSYTLFFFSMSFFILKLSALHYNE